ncbi:MAG: glycoside hydrolase family 9 protein [Coleofasciculaceae cyanobacterium]
MKIGRRFFLGLVTVLAYNYCKKGLTQPILNAAKARIVINQAGYYYNKPKSAILINATKPVNTKVELIDAKTYRVVFATNLGTPLRDEASQDIVQIIDFTQFSGEGSYYLKVGDTQSYSFDIGKEVYKDAFIKLLRSYYLQRCGVFVDDAVTGVSHPPCHLGDGIIAHRDSFHQAGEFKAATGGWHDAGDFGKYVGPTAVTIGRLLSLYEQYPNLFSDRQLSIPEGGNGVPDLLDEVKVGLDWMLKMQRVDGAVYRKLSGKTWPGEIMPHQDVQPRYIYGISTPETAKFAAAMAMAARIYTPYNPMLSQKYLKAAELAWSFLQRQPIMQVDQFEGDESGSGGYLASEWDKEESLKTDKDDRLWAAAELFITTENSVFDQYLTQQIPLFEYTVFEWKDPSSLGLTNYLLQTGSKGSENLKQQIKEKLIVRANNLLNKVNSSGYRLANDKFIWASNKLTAEEGITLACAYKLTGNKSYLRAAFDQLDYLLGRNHFNLSFVSGVGTNSVKNIHHRIARAKKIVIPGLLVGGPNTYAQDNIAPKGLGALSYIDDERSYATNEYAIDYNASLIGLMGMLMGDSQLNSLLG